MADDRVDVERQYDKILVELGDLGVDAVVWIGGVWFRYNTYTYEETFSLFHQAWERGLRVRVHVTEIDDVVAYEASFREDGRFYWLAAADVTPGAQTAKSHPAYKILDDFARIRGNRSCLINLSNGSGAILLQHNGRLNFQFATPLAVIVSEGGLFNNELYEFLGLAARIGGSFLLHVYMSGENPVHHVYLAATDENSLGASWRPEEEVFEAFNTHNELVRAKFQIPAEEMSRLSAMFTPSYFHFDYPKDGEHVRQIPDR